MCGKYRRKCKGYMELVKRFYIYLIEDKEGRRKGKRESNS